MQGRLDYNKTRLILTLIVALVQGGSTAAHAQEESELKEVRQLWQEPTAAYRMKTWWFFGYEHTTDDGITADAESLRKAGFGGVVYYDQNHAKDAEANDAEDAFSESWWHHLQFAAQEAHRCGLSFEVNISNGYCAGGRWIDARHAMQRVAVSEAVVTVLDNGSVLMDGQLDISGPEGYVCDIATMAMPLLDDGKKRYITARYVAQGKGRNGAMQRPTDKTASAGAFSGYGFETLPDVGVLQTSNDSITWRDVVSLEPMYNSQGGYRIRTTAFQPTEGHYWRVRYTEGSRPLTWWYVGSEPKMDRWEERAALQSDFAEAELTPESYNQLGVIVPSQVRHVIDRDFSTLPAGRWRVVRLAAVLTGAKSKHGRKNLLGYECDKLSAEAANLHWDSYVQPILDRVQGISGVTMDSHEGGSQNWTPRMLDEFRQRRGYDFTPWLPVLAGYVVESVERTRQVLYDYRQTISDCIRDNYFAVFQQRATANGITFTAQAIGNALCLPGDAISVKQVVDKPQGEFWTYQRDGAYDVKDCSSAAHLYGKPIASAEALTDCEYKDSPSDLMRVSNIAFAMGAQEFVVCATPHIPFSSTTKPYIAGREYAINRSNPRWEEMKPVWLQAARSMVLLRQGKAAPDVLVFLGDDVPIKTITSRLPAGLDGLDWDACTADALRNRFSVNDGLLQTPDSISYRALIIADKAHMSEETRLMIDRLRREGVMVTRTAEDIPRQLIIEQGDSAVVHTHRRIGKNELFYIANKENYAVSIRFRLQDAPQKLSVWNNADGTVHSLHPNADNIYTLTLPPVSSVFIIYKK
ncbi:MAG: hypothetical protein J6T00_00595 [Bacteroidaceae bacterium]|nr:hypothetical protein [Bacteroidaceae bacterium]